MKGPVSDSSSLIAHRSSLIRLGCLPYLNVKPLVYPFEHGQLPEGWELVYATPAALAGMLQSRELDAAPVSSFACLANPKLRIVPGICVASDGPVRSVLMLSKVDPGSVRSVALDTSSLSGSALLRIVLAENYGAKPAFVPCEPDLGAMLSGHDAALVIGNVAMTSDKTGLRVVDLGEEWKRLTGLPTVFAVWAGPAGSITPEMIGHLAAAREEGLRHIPEICEEESRRLGLPVEVCEDYLTNVMRYDLGEREIESLRVFGVKALEHRLIDVAPEVRLFRQDHECARNA